jgi:ATP phosphoribosyltransferase
VSVIIVRASDVPTYVQYGAADAGVAGRDVLLEHGSDGLYQPLDLEIARCRMVVATRRGFDWAAAVQRGARIVRVHDVAATVDALAMWREIEGDPEVEEE